VRLLFIHDEEAILFASMDFLTDHGRQEMIEMIKRSGIILVDAMLLIL
jgi:hypothetical protein